MRKSQFFILTLALLLPLTSAAQICNLYDDFSSETLDTTRWLEYSNIGFTNEHFVNTSEGTYHIKQNIIGTRETNLQPLINFTPGDTLKYEIIYHGGSGNHQSQPFINGNYPVAQLEVCLFLTAGCGPIGYWNAYPDLGAIPGTYRITQEFTNSTMKMTSLRPDNITIINTFTSFTFPATHAINTHTGHNGLMHFDIDKVYLCKDVETAEEFCNSFNPLTSNTDRKACRNADWQSNEDKNPRDCRVKRIDKEFVCVGDVKAN